MDLGSSKLISRAKVDKVKMTKMVIDQVEQLATAQGYKSLKFFNQKKKDVAFRHRPIDGCRFG